MKTRKRNRLMALALCLCMMVTMLPLAGMTFAAELCPNHAAHDDACGFAQAVEGHECGHAHDDTCGYAEGMGDAPCKHEQGEHDESCGYAPPSEEAPCGHTHDESCGEPDENGEYPDCAHGHKVNDSEAGREGPLGGDGDCGYAPASEGTPCAHQEHDGVCGYGEAEKGAPCKHKHDADCGYIEAVEGKPCGHTCERCDGSEDVMIVGETRAAVVATAPQNLTATIVGDSVYLTWEAPQSDGGAEIIRYQSIHNERETWFDCGERTYDAYHNRTYGTTYTFQVRAVNSAGAGEAASVTVTLPTKDSLPSVPQRLTAIPGQGQVSLSWEAPQSNGGAEIIGYRVTCSAAGGWKDVSAEVYSYTFTNLEVGRSYFFYVCAVTSIGTGEEAAIMATPEPGIYSISGTVKERNSTGIRIRIKLYRDGVEIGKTRSEKDGSYFFGSLLPGEYTVTTGETRGQGINYIEQSSTVIITDENIEELDFELDPSDPSLRKYLISGELQGKSYESGYFPIPNVPVELWQNGERIGSTVTAIYDSDNPRAKFSFLSIMSGNYTLRVPAGTYGGAYQLEYQETFVVENENVYLPIRLQVGTAPDGYTVSGKIQNDIGGGLQGVPVQLLNSNVKMFETTTGADGSFSFPKVSDAAYTLKIPAGIYAGTAYQEANKDITVNGENLSVGGVMLSAATAPGAPQNFTADPGNWQVALSWTDPASDGGAAISGYQVSKDNGANWTNATSATGHTFTNLPTGKSYTFQVRAVNSVGAGEVASATAAPTAPGPSAPQNLYAQYGNQILYLHWKTPVSNGGSAIVKYQYSATADGTDDWKDIPDSGPDTVTYTVTGLTNGTTYTLKVRAVNSNGGVGEAASTTLAPQTVAPSAPRSLTATPGDGQMLLTWDAPESDGGSPITHYQYRYNVDPNSSGAMRYWTNMPDSGPDTVRFTVTGLENGKELVFWVRAVSDSGFSPHAMVTATPQAGATVPGVPQNFNANPGDQQVELSWTAPASNGGAEITKYEVSKDGGANWEGASSETGHTFTDLTNGKSYTFQVRAVNSAGTGAAASVTETPKEATFVLTVINGADTTATGPYAAGAKVNIRANAPQDGKLFDKWTSSGGGSFDDANSPETTFTMPAEAVTVTATYEHDTTAPTGMITVKDNGWTKFLNDITFGVFFKETQQVSITAQDNSGQDVAIAYHKASAAMTLDQVQALAGGKWTAYTDKFSITPNTELVIYARLTDKAGNVTYISSEGIVLDDAAPSFSLEDGKTYDSAQTLTVSDNYALASVKLGGAEQLLPDFTGAETQIALNVNGAYTIEATDKAGNTASITVTIDIPVVTAPNLTGITAPTAITGVANGTPLADINLPGKVALTTTEGDRQADVVWDRSTATPAYDPNSKATQTFTISGTVTLPEGVTNTDNLPLAVQVGVTVAAAEAVTVTGLEIKSNPNKAAYTEGDALDLTGLSVKLTYSDGSDKTVALADFAANHITATPANGAKLSLSDTTVTVSAGGKSASFDITVNAMQQVQTPAFSPAGGTYDSAQSVEITCATEGAKIYYTTDGSSPTAASTLYAGPITVSKTTTINAIAIKDGMKNSAEVSAAYTIQITPGHTHEFGGDWQSDATHHWQLCTAGDGETGNKAAHTAGGWIDDKNLSENELSKRHQECTVCGYTMATVIIVQADGIVEVKPGKDSNWKFHGAFKDLKALRLNGVMMGTLPLSVTSVNLTYPGYEGFAGMAKAGSVEVTLYADFLKTLPAGKYILEAEFASGKTTSTGSTEFTISNGNKPEPEPDPNNPAPDKKPTPDSKPMPDKEPTSPTDAPATGDTSHVWPWVLLMLAALAGCGSLLTYWRISNKKRHR